jgi:hypothetical protein
VAWKDKAAEVAYKHGWYMLNRARLGRKDRVRRTLEEQRARNLQKQREWYLRNRESIRAEAKKRYATDAEYAAAMKAKTEALYRKDKKAWIKKSADYHRANRPRARAWNAKWKKNNPEQVAADRALRRATKIKATPPWVDRSALKAIYAKARRMTEITGVPHQVDHHYPLIHDRLTGLHVPWNLRVITAKENFSKNNRLPEEAFYGN